METILTFLQLKAVQRTFPMTSIRKVEKYTDTLFFIEKNNGQIFSIKLWGDGNISVKEV